MNGAFIIDFWPCFRNNQCMNTAEKTTDNLVEHIATRKPLDPEVYRRIREHAERIAEELRKQHGEMDIAVDLIREVRDEA